MEVSTPVTRTSIVPIAVRRRFRRTGRAALLGLALAIAASCEGGMTGERITGPRSMPPGVSSGQSSPAGEGDEEILRTPPTDPGTGMPASTEAPFPFAVKGDWGAGTPAQAALTAEMCARRTLEPFAVVVTTGDNFYRPDGMATEANYHRPEGCLITFRDHRWRAVWGNHDVGGNSTRDVLGAERNYTWSEGPAQFFMLDSNRVDATQTLWLESALRSSSAPLRIAVFHHPPFSAGSHESNLEVRRSWVPLFERHGVSLVLSGHNHLYEHSIVNNVHYVVTGGGGAALYRCERKETWLLRCDARHHFLLVSAGRKTTTVTALGGGGAEVDRFEVQNRAA